MTSSPTRRGMLYAGVAAAAAAAGLGGAWWKERGSGAGGEVLDAAFWAQSFERPEGGDLVLSSLRGKPLLLNFWATWCPPCVEEMPMIDAFFSRTWWQRLASSRIGHRLAQRRAQVPAAHTRHLPDRFGRVARDGTGQEPGQYRGWIALHAGPEWQRFRGGS